ncbi:MAG: methyltransferase domain-containing protein [Nitrospirae bacterium]|nr:methyltransferase domain-containing protein [Nitrospirota bacterium]
MDTNRVRRTYSVFARLYNIWGWMVARHAHRKALELAGIREGERLVEVAVGTGLMFSKAAVLNRSGLNVGLDLTPSMLVQARNRLHSAGTDGAIFGVANMLAIPLRPAVFDLILNIFVLDLLRPEDIAASLAECHRVLRVGGRIVVVDRVKAETWYHKLFEWFYRLFPSLWGGGRGTSVGPALAAAGFQEIRTERADHWSFPVEVIRAFRPRGEIS